MKRLIFTLITLFAVSFAYSQTIVNVNENGIFFYTEYIESSVIDTINNEDDYSVMYEMKPVYSTSFTTIGPAIIYDIYGHIKYHITSSIFELDQLLQNELRYGAYIVAANGYKPFKVYNGCPLVSFGIK